MISNYQNRAWNTASTVFERKLTETLKTMNTQQTLAGYKTTEDFVNELSKHFKMNKICKNNDILSCFSDKVYWGDNKEEIDISIIKTAKNFGQDNWNTNIVGVQFANGVTGLIAYNPDCTQNPYSNQITGSDCLAVLYDTDGFKNPNTSSKDVRALNIKKLGRECYKEIDGVCLLGPAFKPTPMTLEECAKEVADGKLGLKYCCISGYCKDGYDYWAGAAKQCGGVQHMPSEDQLTKIVSYIYNTDISKIPPQSGFITGITRDDEKAKDLGFDLSSTLEIWGEIQSFGNIYNGYSVYYQQLFSASTVTIVSQYLGDNNPQAICVE